MGVGRADVNARKQPLEIVNLLLRLAQLSAQRKIIFQFLHRVKSLVDTDRRQQRLLQPLLQQPRPHGGDGKVQHVKKRILPTAVP